MGKVLELIVIKSGASDQLSQILEEGVSLVRNSLLIQITTVSNL